MGGAATCGHLGLVKPYFDGNLMMAISCTLAVWPLEKIKGERLQHKNRVVGMIGEVAVYSVADDPHQPGNLRTAGMQDGDVARYGTINLS